MSSTAMTSPQNERTIGLLVVATAALLAPVIAVCPVAGAALLVLAIGLALFWRSIDIATYAVLFVIYSNAAANASKFMGVPSLVANGTIGLLAIPVVYFVVIRKQGIVFGSSFPWLIGMGVVQCLGAIMARRPDVSWVSLTTFVTEAIVLYILVVNAVRSPRVLRGATWALLLAGCVAGGVPLYQDLTRAYDKNFYGFAQIEDEPGFLENDESEVPQKRLSGPIGEKNRYAQVMLMLVPLALFRIRDEKTWALKGAAVVMLMMALIGNFLAFSRSSIVAVGFVLLVAAAFKHVSRLRLAAMGGLAIAALIATPQYRERLSSLVNLTELFRSGKHSQADGALKGRATEMGSALLVFVDHPFLGVGPGQFRFYSREYGERIGLRALAPERQAHSLILDVAAENGMAGLFCLLGLFATLGYRLGDRQGLSTWERPPPGAISAWGPTLIGSDYLYMVVMYFMTGLFLHFAFIRYFWVMIALTDAAMIMRSRGPMDDSPNPAPQTPNWR